MNRKKMLLKDLMTSHIKEAEAILELVKDYEMQNSQEFLDWQDELNEISNYDFIS